MRVDVDLSGLKRLTEDASKALSADSVHTAVVVPVIAAASDERRTHAYRNRTGRLQSSTQAVSIARGVTVEVWLQAGPFSVPPYAEYVNRRGFMGIDAYAKRADGEIKDRLGKLLR